MKNIINEEDFKVKKLQEWGFKKFTLNEDRVDIKLHNTWIEAKQKNEDSYTMLAQLIFTAYKVQNYKQLPLYFACFNSQKGAIIENHQAQEVFKHTDINWLQTPSKLDKKTIERIKFLIKSVQEYNLDEFGKKLKEIEKNAILHKQNINKNNFVIVYNEWLDAVGKQIDEKDLHPDCYLADLMTDGKKSIAEKLQVVLGKNFDDYCYKKKFSTQLYQDIYIKDQKSYLNFWSKYKRPPAEEYQDYILNRRDLLQPANVREVKGEFFTPKIWCAKSKDYLAKAFGDNWQDEYYIWDCCTGTGNLCQGLVNQDRVFMSTLNQEDVKIMEQLNIMPDSVKFQFDFLNDEWKPVIDGGKIPNTLWKIIKEKSDKLIIYINPPYLESTNKNTVSGTGKNRTGATTTDLKKLMTLDGLGKESNELFMQFYYRIYKEMPNCKIGSFSTLKNCTAPNFEKFRGFFKSKFCCGFVCQANTFDNVKGKFPISFQVWDCEAKEDFKNTLHFDVLSNEGECVADKVVYVYKTEHFINDWFLSNNKNSEDHLCYVQKKGSDFQNQTYIALYSDECNHANKITQSNLVQALIYVAVRLCIPATWLNDRDQFTKPNKASVLNATVIDLGTDPNKEHFEFEQDLDFINNCIVFALFEKNFTNWVLFPNSWIGLNGFDRDMTIYNLLLKGKTFTPQAQTLLDTAKEIYKLYYEEFDTQANQKANPNASWNEVYKALKESKNLKFIDLWEEFKKQKQILALDLASDVYKYGFLRG